LISGSRRGVNEVFGLLECYATYIGNYYRGFATTYRDNRQGVTDSLSRNVGKQLPIYAA